MTDVKDTVSVDHYNSGLFHFSKEKSQAEEPDALTPNLTLDDKTLKNIITHLYYTERDRGAGSRLCVLAHVWSKIEHPRS